MYQSIIRDNTLYSILNLECAFVPGSCGFVVHIHWVIRAQLHKVTSLSDRSNITLWTSRSGSRVTGWPSFLLNLEHLGRPNYSGHNIFSEYIMIISFILHVFGTERMYDSLVYAVPWRSAWFCFRSTRTQNIETPLALQSTISTSDVGKWPTHAYFDENQQTRTGSQNLLL